MTPEATTRAEVELVEFDDSHAPLLFEWMRDPESVSMAAFTAPDPDDRLAFDQWLARIRANSANLLRTILFAGVPVGIISTFDIDGEREVTYWIDRVVWGRGIGSEALRAILRVEKTRPLAARAASANIGSRTVLTRAGFVEVGRDVGRDVGFAAGAGGEIEETIFRLES